MTAVDPVKINSAADFCSCPWMPSHLYCQNQLEVPLRKPVSRRRFGRKVRNETWTGRVPEWLSLVDRSAGIERLKNRESIHVLSKQYEYWPAFGPVNVI